MDSASERRPFPGFVQALGLLCLLGAVGLVAFGGYLAVMRERVVGSEGEFVADPRLILIGNSISFLVVLWVGWRVSRRPLAALFPLRPLSAPQTLAVGMTMAGLLPVMLAIIALMLRIPGLRFLEDTFLEFGNQIMGMLRDSPVATLIALVVLAPVTEELFFRGLLIPGFRARYGPAKAVVLSALLFSLAHLSPAQLPATIVLGLVLGWLYLRTGNLVACILAHAVNNGVVAVAALLDPEAAEAASANQTEVPLGLTVGGLVLLVIGMAWIRRLNPAPSPLPAGGTPAPPVSPPQHL